jgi:hypothetical protein
MTCVSGGAKEGLGGGGGGGGGGLQPPCRGALAPPSGKINRFVGENGGKNLKQFRKTRSCRHARSPACYYINESFSTLIFIRFCTS